jgi:hypothetical protein
MHFIDKILSHRIRRADGKYIKKHLIKSGDIGEFEFLTRFQCGEKMWLTELCFADVAHDEYCTDFIEYCEIHGIEYA